MRFLLETPGARTLDDVVRAGEAAHREGLDGVLVAATEAFPAPAIVAAALAARVPDVRIAIETAVGDRHPLEVAEEVALVDVESGGRTILVARPAAGREDAFAEALDLLRLCFGAAPFRFEGEHWQVPANLEQNVNNPEHRVRMLPAPAQPRLELWTAGAAGRAAGAERGLGHLADAGEPWVEAAGAASLGAPRARREQWDGARSVLARLRAGREALGQDWAVVAAPTEAVPDLGAIVRPRVQLDRLPDGLEAFWDAERPWELAR